jgi:Serine phosphatase RsbU, regulator of sigma subunit
LQAQQHQQILQSIDYARVIQDAMLDRSKQQMAQQLNDWCLHWQPRDGVGGDYYAFHQDEHGWLALIADCTGHGIPGAFMTVSPAIRAGKRAAEKPSGTVRSAAITESSY